MYSLSIMKRKGEQGESRYIRDAFVDSDYRRSRYDRDGDESVYHGGIFHYISVLIGIAVVIAMTFIFFHYSSFISNKLGKTEMNVITRLMGLILAVVAIGMIGAGLKGMFPILVS